MTPKHFNLALKGAVAKEKRFWNTVSIAMGGKPADDTDNSGGFENLSAIMKSLKKTKKRSEV